MTRKFYGLIGAHRVGKTTLAKQVAEEVDAPFCKTSVAGVLESLGVDPQADLPFVQRLRVQNLILEALLAEYAKAYTEYPNEQLLIVDRTPLDVLAYTTSEILRETITPELGLLMAEHEQRCFEAMNFHFIGGAMVQPGIPIVPNASSGTPNRFYQRHINATMLEASLNARMNVPILILGSDNLELQSRVSDVSDHCDAIISMSSQVERVAPTAYGSNLIH